MGQSASKAFTSPQPGPLHRYVEVSVVHCKACMLYCPVQAAFIDTSLFPPQGETGEWRAIGNTVMSSSRNAK